MNIHIAEMFLSVQGEGYYTGTPMFFVRLAGCSVGKPIPGGNPSYVEECTLYDGRKFLCDTNFRRTQTLSIEQVVEQLPHVNHISITGGEPFNQQAAVKELVDAVRTFVKPHIETSGTVEPSWLFDPTYRDVWVTVSPKLGATPMMMARANEIKFLVDEDFDPVVAEDMLRGLNNVYVWLQPVNFENEMDTGNVQRCLQLLEKYPSWKLSVQLHKVLGVR